MGKGHLIPYVCEAVEAPAAPGRVCLIKWGDNTRRDGQRQIVDEAAAQAILNEFRDRGIDMVIDREHQTEGGAFASPDGTAPAAGWIKQGTLEVVPGEGIFGAVDWTPWGARAVCNKEYRYLSPKTFMDPATRRVMEIDNIGLTNTPAIKGMPALVNKDNASPGSGRVPRAGASEKKEVAMTRLIEVLALKAEASEDEIVAAVNSLKGKAAIADALVGVAGSELADVGGGELVTALNKADAGEVKTALVKSLNSLRNPKDMVPKSSVDQLTERLSAAEGKLRDADWAAFLNKHQRRIPPAKAESVKKHWTFDAAAAEEVVSAWPELVNTAGSTAPVTGAPTDRTALINSHRAKFRSEPDLARICASERVFVSGQLVAAGQPAISDEEARTLALVG